MGAIFKLSEAAAIGLHAAMFLAAEKGRTATAGQIAGAFGFSAAHLTKVMQDLSRNGLVEATRGPGGGYRLSRSAESISLLDVVEAVRGKLDAERCLLKQRLCSNPGCLLGPLMQNLNLQTIKYLRAHSLSEQTAVLRKTKSKSSVRETRAVSRSTKKT